MPFTFPEIFYKRLEQMTNVCLIESGQGVAQVVLYPKAFDTLSMHLGRQYDLTEIDLYVTGGLVVVKKLGS